jgi:hypothetical protein
VPLDDLVAAPEEGDPRTRLKPARVKGRTVLPLTRQPDGMQAWKIVIPITKVTPEPRGHDGHEWIYVLSAQDLQPARRKGTQRPFALLVHSSLVSGACMLALSLMFEGPAQDLHALGEIGVRAAAALAYIVIVATLAGYGAWYWLLARYASSTVSGFPLLAPVAALTSTWILLGERASEWQLAGSGLVVGGVGFAIWSARRATSLLKHDACGRMRQPPELPASRSSYRRPWAERCWAWWSAR